jgi:hypothetical protein
MVFFYTYIRRKKVEAKIEKAEKSSKEIAEKVTLNSYLYQNNSIIHSLLLLHSYAILTYFSHAPRFKKCRVLCNKQRPKLREWQRQNIQTYRITLIRESGRVKVQASGVFCRSIIPNTLK